MLATSPNNFLNLAYVFYLAQDQLSADMYSFVAKEIDYANYFQTVSVHQGKATESLEVSWCGQQRKVGLLIPKASLEEGW